MTRARIGYLVSDRRQNQRNDLLDQLRVLEKEIENDQNCQRGNEGHSTSALYALARRISLNNVSHFSADFA